MSNQNPSIVNLATIAEVIALDSVGKWGTSPNFFERMPSQRSQMKVQWGKLIKRIF